LAGLSPKFESLLRLWEERRGARTLPCRRDFLPEELKAWMGHLAIVSLHDGPRRFFAELAGEMVVQYDGADFTGKYLEDAIPPRVVAALVAPYDAAIEHRRPVYCRIGPGPLRGRITSVDRLILPCGTDGETIDRFIVAIYVPNFNRLNGSVLGEADKTAPFDTAEEVLGDDQYMYIVVDPVT
jgi:hypothetical protein